MSPHDKGFIISVITWWNNVCSVRAVFVMSVDAYHGWLKPNHDVFHSDIRVLWCNTPLAKNERGAYITPTAPGTFLQSLYIGFD